MRFDIAIVGAGPAGSYAAYLPAKQGVRVAVYSDAGGLAESVAIAARPRWLCAPRLPIAAVARI